MSFAEFVMETDGVDAEMEAAAGRAKALEASMAEAIGEEAAARLLRDEGLQRQFSEWMGLGRRLRGLRAVAEIRALIAAGREPREGAGR